MTNETNDTTQHEAPRGDYLWDRSGEPDAEVARLEGELARHRWTGRVDDLGELPPQVPLRPSASSSAPWMRIGVKLAAAALLAVTFTWWLGDGDALFRSGGYRLVALKGRPFIEKSDAKAPADGTSPIAGERLIIDENSRARLTVADIGSVLLEGGTTVRIEDAGTSDDAEYLLFLERGTVTASIFAAPRVFQVGTPAGIAVDLGCIYETTVDDDGNTFLSVVSGQVSFETDSRKVVVPSGAHTRTWPGVGPGTPVWNDAPSALVKAIETYDAGDRNADTLGAVLDAARDEDSLTLWHLLADDDRAVRVRVFDRMVARVPAPGGITRGGIVAGDPIMMAAWKDALGWSW